MDIINIFSTRCFETYLSVFIREGKMETEILLPTCDPTSVVLEGEELERFTDMGPKAVTYAIYGPNDEENLTNILRLYQANPKVLAIGCHYNNDDWWESVLSSIPPSVEYLDISKCRGLGSHMHKFIPETVHSIKALHESERISRMTGTVCISEVQNSPLTVNCWKLKISEGKKNLVIQSETVEIIDYEFLGNTALNCPKLKHLSSHGTHIVSAEQLETLVCLSLQNPSSSLKTLWCWEGVDETKYPSLERYETSDPTQCFGTKTLLSQLR